MSKKSTTYPGGRRAELTGAARHLMAAIAYENTSVDCRNPALSIWSQWHQTAIRQALMELTEYFPLTESLLNALTTITLDTATHPINLHDGHGTVTHMRRVLGAYFEYLRRKAASTPRVR